MARVNFIALQEALQVPIQKACGKKAATLAKDHFEEVKKKFLDKFVENPITQEIEQGEKGQGTEGTENLFGFIGFPESSTPIEDLINYFEENIVFNDKGIYDKSLRQYYFSVQIPSKDDVRKETPMPKWITGSWVQSIESGISGLNRYIYRKGAGRSQQGIQNTKVIKEDEYQPKPYVTPLLLFLRKALREGTYT